MSHAKIINGTWTRNVTWSNGSAWRTDIFKTTPANPGLKNAVFLLSDGRKVTIGAAELRRLLEGGTDHFDDKIWGPFNIKSIAKTLNGTPISMEVS